MILTSANEISKAFADRTLFEGVSLGISEGDRIGLVGPNGAGKSTLLRILAGQMKPDSGKLSSKRGLKIGFLDQSPTFEGDDDIMTAMLSKCDDPYEYMAKGYEILSYLELDKFGAEFKVAELSGGWKKRVALARELVMEPELLILDEPTNHLDVSSILWLEGWLKAARFAMLMVTHDRLFLQRVANHIWDLDPRNPHYLLSVDGDYTQYMETKEQELAAQKRHEAVEKNRLRRETEWLRRGAAARQTKQTARIEAAGDLKDDVARLKEKNRVRNVNIDFGEPDHSPKKLIEATGISKSYGDKFLFEDLDLLLTPKTRLGLLGDNGSGKSTLIKILLGLEKPDTGTVKMAEAAQVAYFEQSRETLNFEKSVIDNLSPENDQVFFQGKPVHVRSYLDRFYFTGQKADMPVRKLSGGEQARLRLAQLMLRQSQILVLDEPTNDLDTAMLDSLEDSLREFNGAVILVTHDRYFLDSVANQILAFSGEHFGGHMPMQKFASYYQWEQWFDEQKRLERENKSSAKAGGGANGGAPKKKLSFNEKFELENMEATIAKLEAALKSLTAESQKPDVVGNHVRLADVHSQMAKVQSEIETKYAKWSELDARK